MAALCLRVASAVTPEGGSIVRFEVVDSGPGITADAQVRLFQPYGQGDASIARRFGGTGLGLSICKELLRLMKGSIEVESQPGAGSLFALPCRWCRAEPRRATVDVDRIDGPGGICLNLTVCWWKTTGQSDRDGGGAARPRRPSAHGRWRRTGAKPVGA
jgi:hypothetical protein